MGDLSDKGSDCDDIMNSSKSSPERSGSTSSDGASLIKTCVDCGTSKTPLWRGGPAGPKSLCNACGIKSRKRRRALLMGQTKDDKKPKKPIIDASSTCSGDSQSSGLTSIKNSNSNNSNNGDFCLKKRLIKFGSEVVMQRPRSKIRKQTKKVCEEEQAAFLLMALSCGSIFA